MLQAREKSKPTEMALISDNDIIRRAISEHKNTQVIFQQESCRYIKYFSSS